MERIKRWLSLALAVVAYPLTLPARLDPFNTRALYTSRARRAWYRLVGPQQRLALVGAALLFAAIYPANAMPVWSAKTGVINYVSAHKLGPIGMGSGVMFAGMAGQKVLYPFRMGTVKRRIPIGSYAVTLGGSIPAIQIPQVGMLSRVLVDVEGTYTKANSSGTNLLDGYDALLGRAQIMLNNGSANIVDVSGVGFNIHNRGLSPALPIKRGLVTTAGAQAFTYKGILSVNANQRRQFEMGLINLQAPELRATINLTFNPIASIFATPADVTNFLATAYVSYEYYEIPDLNTFAMPPLTIVRTIEEAPIAITATGDNLYQLPRLGTMVDFNVVLVLNNLYANVISNLTEFKLRYNKSDVQYDVLIGDEETYEAENFGIGQGPSRTFLFDQALSWNLWSAGDRAWNGGDFRDAIDTEENTTTELIPTVKAGTSFNAGKDNFFYVRRVVQRIVQAPPPQS